MDWTTAYIVAAVIVLVVSIAGMVAGCRLIHRYRQRAEVDRAIRAFRLQREVLEAKFFDLARATGKPRGLRWIECDWQNPVTFAREARTGLLTAFVAVNIRFEAIPGGDMEDVAAVSTIRDAAAVFHYDRSVWGTGGRALFNMNPQEAVEKLDGQFHPVSISTSSPARSVI